MEQKKLCRSMEDKAICGVCSGFAKYFEIDPIIIRLAVVLLALAGTIGIWFYIIAAIVMPRDTDVYYQDAAAQTTYRYDPETGRPLYSDGTNVYENYAGQRNAPDASTNEETVYETAETVYETAETADAAGEDSEGFAPHAETNSTGGQYNGTYEQPQPKAYYQTPPAPTRKVSRGSRNTGILLIALGVIILAKILLPKLTLWIPIAIALIFLGIFLLCRKN